MKGKKRNNAVGVKGRSGRKTKIEEVRIYLEAQKEKITQDALIDLANSVVFSALKGINNQIEKSGRANHYQLKDLAMPITLKGITDKSESKLKFNLDEDELKKVLADKLTKILTNDRPRLEQTNRGDENQEPEGKVQ